MSDSVDRVFVHALNTVKKIPRTGSARPPPSDRLKLYGLYKQSMEGNVEGVMGRPEGDSEEIRPEREKWDAWSAQHGLSRTEAKRRYISTLIETMHKYASTTAEARELVAELEFVWDQIKSNSVSSSGSSPVQAPGLPGGLQQSRSYTSILPRGGVGARDDQEGGLRALRPVSDGDEEEMDEEEEMEEARDGEYADDGEMVARSGDDEGKRNYEARNRKWRKRMEQALMRMTTEVAALREQLEAKRFLGRQRRKTLWAWMRWLVWVTIRHLVVSAAIMGLVLIWARRKHDKRVEQGLGLLLEVAAEQARRLQIPRLLRLPRRG